MRTTNNFFWIALQICFFFTALPCDADETKPSGAELRYLICPGRHGHPMVLQQETQRQQVVGASQLESFCREEIRWQSNSDWLCRIGDVVLLADYPLDRIGHVNSETHRAGELPKINVECRKLSERCKGERFLLRNKFCYNEISSGTKDYWREFARQANQPPRALRDVCASRRQLKVSYPVRRISTGCSSESCVLQHASSIWKIIWRWRTAPSEEQLDLSYFELNSLVVRSRDLEETIDRVGVYCVSYKTHRRTVETSELVSYQVEQAKFVDSLPESWPEELPSTPLSNDPGAVKTRVPTCKSDDDCTQGVGKGTCVLKAFAGRDTWSPNPQYRCICMKGPVVFGCVAKSK